MASIAEILLAKGRMMADARRQSGERSSQLAQNLAGIAANSIGTYLEQKEDRPYRDARTRQIQLDNDTTSAALSDRTQKREDTSILQSAMSSGMGAPEVESQLTQLGRGDLVSQFKATKAKDDALAMQTRETKLNLVKLQTEYLRDKARRMRPFVDGPEGMHVMEAAIKEAVEDGAFDQQEADQFWQQISGNPEALPKLIDALDPQAAVKVGTREIKTLGADGTETIQIVEDAPGQSFTSTPPKPKPDMREIVVKGPNGRPMKKLVPAEALEAGIEQYEAPRGDAQQSFQAKEVLNDDGKPVTANFDARSGKYFDAAGKQIVNPRPVPSAMETQDSRKFKQAEPILRSVSELSEKINTQTGLIAKMRGGAERVKAQANYNDDIAEYEALISGFTPLVARALGHIGVLTQQDVDSVKALFPKPGDSKSLRDRKIARIKTIIGELEAGANPATPSSGAPSPTGANADPLGLGF